MDVSTLHARTVAEFTARVEAVGDGPVGRPHAVHRVVGARAGQPRGR